MRDKSVLASNRSVPRRFFVIAALVAVAHNFSAESVPLNTELLPNDPEFFRQWSLEQINDVDMDVVTAWEILNEMDSDKLAPVTVAVMDGSIELDGFREFVGRTVPGCDIKEAYKRLRSVNAITREECKPPKLELTAHGNGVAGIIAAKYNNSRAITGVAGPYDISIMPLNGYAAPTIFGNPPDFELNDRYFVAAVRFAADNGARIFGTAIGYLSSQVDTSIMRDAVKYANEKGMLIIVAAGNRDTPGDPFPENPFNQDVLPASIEEPNIIGVGSIDLSGGLASHSYYGRHVDIAAPGAYITTTDSHIVTDIPLSFVTDDDYGINGTSYAAPMVAGVAALALLAFPELTVDQLKQAVLSGAQQTEELSREVCYCEEEPDVERSCDDLDACADGLQVTFPVQSGGFIRAPRVLEKAAELVGKTVELDGYPLDSYPKAAFSVSGDGASAEVRNWEGVVIGEGDTIEFSAATNPNCDYEWDFGDGATTFGESTAGYSYSVAGEYKARMYAIDTMTHLYDESPPLKVIVYPRGLDHVIIIRSIDGEEGEVLNSYFIQSNFRIYTSLFGAHRVQGSGFFDVDGVSYWLTVRTDFPLLGVSYKYFKLEYGDQHEVLDSLRALTTGGIEYEKFGDGETETISIDIPPYKIVLSVSD